MAKKVNVELNMTPFIGLFALLVVMLLLTAVWSNLAALATNTGSGSNDSPQDKKIQLFVTVMQNKVEVTENQTGLIIPHKGNHIDFSALSVHLETWKEKYPDKTDVILNTENEVTYEELIGVFDALVGHGFPDVGINTQ